MAKPSHINKKTYTPKIELVPIDSINEYAGNARTHPEGQIEQISESIKRSGFLNPILVDDENVLISGHGRLRAARKIGLKKIPIIRAEHLSKQEVKAYRIFDNQSALMSAWDRDLLRIEMHVLKTDGYPLELLGFGKAELVSFQTQPGPPEQFAAVGEDVAIEHQCPKCGHRWSGSSAPSDKQKPASAKRNGKK